jgi:hypothetical protein
MMASCAGIPIFDDSSTLGVAPANVVTLSRVIGAAGGFAASIRLAEAPPACLSQLFVAGRQHRHGASWVTRDG